MTSYFHNANDAGGEGGVVHGAQHGGVVHEESQHTGHHQLDRKHRLVPMVILHRLQHQQSEFRSCVRDEVAVMRPMPKHGSV